MNKPIRDKDLIILGAGAAGLTAGIYAGRLKLDTLILENEIVGGQIRDAYVIENYPGFSRIDGAELVNRMQAQAVESGAVIDEFDPVVRMELGGLEKIVETEGALYRARAVILATGSRRRHLPIPEEREFQGKGIHYCELCDGHLYEGRDLVVVGGGNSALLAARVLTRYARSLTIVHRRDAFRAERKLQDEVLSDPKVTVRWNSEIRHAAGDGFLQTIELEQVRTGERVILRADGVFVAIGHTPGTEMVHGLLPLDPEGFVLADETTVTPIPGVFAAGDVRKKSFRQLTTSVSDGTNAALEAEAYLQARRNETAGTTAIA